MKHALKIAVLTAIFVSVVSCTATIDRQYTDLQLILEHQQKK